MIPVSVSPTAHALVIHAPVKAIPHAHARVTLHVPARAIHAITAHACTLVVLIISKIEN